MPLLSTLNINLVPLTDLSGSTIALVNAASPGSPPAASFTYDPSGNTTVSGSANSWPFEYLGMEHEITDPANLYFLPSSNIYNPQMQAALSQVRAQRLSGARGRLLCGVKNLGIPRAAATRGNDDCWFCA